MPSDAVYPTFVQSIVVKDLVISGTTRAIVAFATDVGFLIAAAIVFLEGGKYLGVPLTTLLASAGVGGLAIALGAQDTLRNLFGSMMIFLDRPYRVGERIALKRYDGIVEEIGLRSTKIRLLNGHVACIPNEEMARTDIENIARRSHVRRVANLHIPASSPESVGRFQTIRRFEPVYAVFPVVFCCFLSVCQIMNELKMRKLDSHLYIA